MKKTRGCNISKGDLIGCGVESEKCTKEARYVADLGAAGKLKLCGWHSLRLKTCFPYVPQTKLVVK